MTSGGASARDQVLVEIEKMLPDVAGRAEAADRDRKVPAETIAALVESNLLYLLAPRALGGLEADFSVSSAATRRLATACGSTAWLFAVLNESMWISSLFSREAQEEVWAQKPIVCASILPLGFATRVPGGYRINGHWGFLSGSDYANWVVLTARIENGASGADGLLVFIVRKSEVTMLNDWNVMGLRGTGSHGGVVKDLFVPDYRTIQQSSMANGTPPGREVHPGYLLARAPRGLLTAFSLTPVIVGLASKALELGRTVIRSPSAAAQPDWVSVQTKFAEATMEVRQANAILDTYSDRSDRMLESGQTISDADVAETRLYASYMVRLAHQAVERIRYISGSKWLYDGHPLQRVLRDAEAAASHRSANWEVAALGFCASIA